MIATRDTPATVLVKAIAAINILGNLFAWALTSVYFAVLLPPLITGSCTEGLWDRMFFVLVVLGFVFSVIGPINGRWVFPLVREARKKLPPINGQDPDPGEIASLRELAGKLLDLPAKLAMTTLGGWLIGSIILSALPHVLPESFPWTHELSHRMSAWMVLVPAPLTVCWVYFSQEHWLRTKMVAFFPPQALSTVPPTFRINVLPKTLAVSLIMTVIPLAIVSHVTLHQIHEIQAGRQSVENFLIHMPPVVGFLCAVFIVVAAGLSIFMAKSLARRLAIFESAMDAVSEGNLEVAVPVVSNDEIGHAGEGFNQMVRDLRVLDNVKDTFGRYLSKDVVDEILKSQGGVELTGELRDMTILVSDLRGFTAITESLKPRQVLETINRYLEVMTDVIMKHKGTIDEFTGDGILVFFGAPKVMADHCSRAVDCALDMQRSMARLNEDNRMVGLPELHMGIGINCGHLIVGNIGSEKRKKYGAVGSPINIAFRIEAETRGGEILLSTEVLNNLNGNVVVEPAKEAMLKGVDKPVTLYRLVGKTQTW